MPTIRSLPLFPLELVLYPGERLPLHIFEERYKTLVAYCLDEEAPFGIVLADEDAAGERGVEQIGSTATVDRVTERYEDGRLDILVVGQQRFRIEHVYNERSYMTADVEMLPEEADESVETPVRERLITQHMKLLELAGHTVRPSLYEDVERLSFILAQNAGLENEQKQQVLEMASEKERMAFLIQHFEALIPQMERQEDLRKKIRSDGYFKDFPV